MKKNILLLAIILIMLGLFFWNKRTVNLILTNTGVIVYPEPPYYYKSFFLIQTSGKDIESQICRRINWLKFNEIESQRKCEINWENRLVINKDDNYYIGIGCSIKKIEYNYFSKYFISYNRPTQKVLYFSSNNNPELTPVKNERSIFIYKGDVILIP